MHDSREALYKRVEKKVEMMGVREWKKGFESEKSI